MNTHKDLDVWNRGIDLVEMIYKSTRKFPSEEKSGLTSQMRRAAVSVPSNISEGQARRSSAEFNRFISISQGSLAELETRLIISTKLNFCDVQQTNVILKKTYELQKMLNYLQIKLAACN